MPSTSKLAAAAVISVATTTALAGCGKATSRQRLGPPRVPSIAPRSLSVHPDELSPTAGLRRIPLNHHDEGNPETAQILPALEQALTDRLPADQYGCVVIPPDSAATNPTKLRVLLRSQASVQDTRAIVARLGATRYASVVVSPTQWRQAQRRSLIARLKREAARYSIDGEPASRFVADETEINKTSCPRVEIAQVTGHADYRRWIAQTRATYPGRIALTPILNGGPITLKPTGSHVLQQIRPRTQRR